MITHYAERQDTFGFDYPTGAATLRSQRTVSLGVVAVLVIATVTLALSVDVDPLSPGYAVSTWPIVRHAERAAVLPARS